MSSICLEVRSRFTTGNGGMDAEVCSCFIAVSGLALDLDVEGSSCFTTAAAGAATAAADGLADVAFGAFAAVRLLFRCCSFFFQGWCPHVRPLVP